VKRPIKRAFEGRNEFCSRVETIIVLAAGVPGRAENLVSLRHDPSGERVDRIHGRSTAVG
jgi:hypothetical protein